MITNVLHLILLVALTKCSNEMIVEGQFKACYVDEVNSLLKIEKCPQSLTEQTISRDSFERKNIHNEAFVFSKHSNYLEGEGFECSKKQLEYKLKTSFFGKKSTEFQSFDIKLSRLECLSMISENVCHGIQMNCSIGESCIYKQPRLANMIHPGWWSSSTFILYECSFRKKLLLSNSHIINVLPNAIGSCRINDKKCELPSSIVVWQDEIIRSCLYERLFEINDLNEFRDKSTDEILFFYSNSQKMLFYLNRNKSTEIDCNGNIFIPTTEGFYLSFFTNKTETKTNLLKLQQSKLNIIHVQDKDFQSIILSQDDYAIFSVLQKNIIFACSAFINTIRSNMIHDDIFVPYDLGGNKEVIFYFRNGASYLPICRNISQIKVIEDQVFHKNLCFEDIRIKYKSDRSLKMMDGFLRKNGIVTHFSKRIDCSKILNELSIVLEDYIITRTTNMKIEIFKVDNVHSTQFSKSFWNMNDLKKLFSHHEYLSERVGLLENAQELVYSQIQTAVINQDDIYQQLVSETKEHEEGIFDTIGKKISKTLSNAYNNILEIIFFFFVIFILMILLIKIR